MASFALRVAGLAMLAIAAARSSAAAAPWWQPSTNSTALRFDYMLNQAFDPARHVIPGVQVYLVDGWETDASSVAAAKAAGLFPVCYFSAGSHENWRPDAASFAAADIGAPLQGWPGERWLNVRSANVKAIMTQRMQMCLDKGFVGVDPDNVDGFANNNGIDPPLTADDQLAFNTWLADTAHSMGLAAGLKNDVRQIQDLAPSFDFFVNEQCAEFSECGAYAPAAALGKPVFSIEYQAAAFAAACKCQATYGITSILKKLDLSPTFRVECLSPSSGTCTLLDNGDSSSGGGTDTPPSGNGGAVAKPKNAARGVAPAGSLAAAAIAGAALACLLL